MHGMIALLDFVVDSWNQWKGFSWVVSYVVGGGGGSERGAL